MWGRETETETETETWIQREASSLAQGAEIWSMEKSKRWGVGLGGLGGDDRTTPKQEQDEWKRESALLLLLLLQAFPFGGWRKYQRRKNGSFFQIGAALSYAWIKVGALCFSPSLSTNNNDCFQQACEIWQNFGRLKFNLVCERKFASVARFWVYGRGRAPPFEYFPPAGLFHFVHTFEGLIIGLSRHEWKMKLPIKCNKS